MRVSCKEKIRNEEIKQLGVEDAEYEDMQRMEESTLSKIKNGKTQKKEVQNNMGNGRVIMGTESNKGETFGAMEEQWSNGE